MGEVALINDVRPISTGKFHTIRSDHVLTTSGDEHGFEFDIAFHQLRASTFDVNPAYGAPILFPLGSCPFHARDRDSAAILPGVASIVIAVPSPEA